MSVFSGLFFEKHLKYIKLDEDFVQFTKMNLSYLLKVIRFVISCFAVYSHGVFMFQNNYDKEYLGHVYTRPVVTYEELRRGQVKTTDPVRIQYNTKDQYKRTAKMLGLMDDFKVGPTRPQTEWMLTCFLSFRAEFQEQATTGSFQYFTTINGSISRRAAIGRATICRGVNASDGSELFGTLGTNEQIYFDEHYRRISHANLEQFFLCDINRNVNVNIGKARNKRISEQMILNERPICLCNIYLI